MKPCRPALLTSLLVAHALLAGSPAHAQLAKSQVPYGAPDQPSSAPDDTPAEAGPALGPSSPGPGLDERTHAFFMPTGNVLRAGEVELRSHALYTYNELAYGVTDNVEISASAPIVPFFASAGARAQLLPRSSSLRLVASAGMWTGLLDDSFVGKITGISGAATLAYQSRSLNLHVTLGAMHLTEHEYDYNDEEIVVLASTGAVMGNDTYAFFVELGNLRAIGDNEIIPGGMLGIKFMGKRFAADLGLLGGNLEDDYLHIIPFMSTALRF